MEFLFIEDDLKVAQAIKAAWPDKADTLVFSYSFRQSLPVVQSAEIERFDAVAIDLQLPDGSGLEILRTARARSTVPLVVISGFGDAHSRAEAIEMGADDYVMKPFLVRELRARILRLVENRRKAAASEPHRSWRIGAVKCDLQKKLLVGEHSSVPLTAMESRILEQLYENRNRDLAKSYIYKTALFRAYDPRDKTLDVYISRLRKKLGSLDPASADLIQTIRGTGYTLRA